MSNEIYKSLDSKQIEKLLTQKKDNTLFEIYSLLRKEKAIDETFLKFELDLRHEKLKPQFSLVYEKINGKLTLIAVATEYTYHSTKKKQELFHLHDLTISKEHRTEQLEIDLLNYVSKKCKKQGFLNLNINLDKRLESILRKIIIQKKQRSSHLIGKNTTQKVATNRAIKTLHLK